MGEQNSSKNLSGGLHVNIGEIVLLHSLKLEVAGYVREYDRTRVTFSYENPALDPSFYTNTTDITGSGLVPRGNLSRGDREYFLCKFDSFEVLAPPVNYPADNELQDKVDRFDHPTDKGENYYLNGRFRAKVGEVVLLSNRKGLTLAGHVLKYDPSLLTLVHENPLSLHYGKAGPWGWYYRKNWGEGIRSYRLKVFTEYCILKRLGEKKEERTDSLDFQ
jgi:hypothetical protein